MAKPSKLAHLSAAKFNLKRQIAANSKSNASHGLNSLNDDISLREEFATVDAICVNTSANFPFLIDSNDFSKTDNFELPRDFDATNGEYYLVYYVSQEKSKELFVGQISTDLLCMPETEEAYKKFLFSLALGIGGGKAIIDKTKFDALPNRGDLLTIDIVRGDHAYSSNIISVQASKVLKCPDLPPPPGQTSSPTGGAPVSPEQPSQTAGNLPPLNYNGGPGSTSSRVIGGKTVIFNEKKSQADIDGVKFYGGLVVNFSGQGKKRTIRPTSIVVHYSCCKNPPNGMLSVLGPDKVISNGTIVGTHFSCDTKGNKYQHLEVNRIANHCPYWNDKGIGIDMDGWGYGGCRGPSSSRWTPAPDPMYKALYEIVEELVKKFGIPRRAIWPVPEGKQNWFLPTPRPFGGADEKERSRNSRRFDGIIAHGHIQSNRADGIDGVYYLKLRYEGKDHLTAYNLMVNTINSYKPPVETKPTPKKKQDDKVGVKGKKNK